MARVVRTNVPPGSLLARYAGQPGCYTDTFEAAIDRSITLQEFVAAFYQTPLFRLERVILRIGARNRSIRSLRQ